MARDFLRESKKLGLSLVVKRLPSSTRTALEASLAVGCQIDQIAKSIIFETLEKEPVLVVTSGKNRVNEEKLAKILGKEVKKADPDFVKENTGFAIGGVPPFGHKKKIKTFIDKDLFNFSEIWAAAGDSFSVFKTTGEELRRITGGEVIEVS